MKKRKNKERVLSIKKSKFNIYDFIIFFIEKND